MKPFRPPHDFECPVCFPPSERRLWPMTLVLVPVVVYLIARWLIS